MKLTNEQKDRFGRAKSASELSAMLNEMGLPVPAEQAAALYSDLQGEMSDAELAAVTGGCGNEDTTERTKMKCASCGMWWTWVGNYQNGIAYECPECKNKSMVGIEFYHEA